MGTSNDALSVLEQMIMMATLRHHPDAYGISIHDDIEKRTGKAPSLASVYAALERLKERGFLASRQGETTAARGGRRKLHFELTGAGRLVLNQSFQALEKMRVGLPEGVIA